MRLYILSQSSSFLLDYIMYHNDPYDPTLETNFYVPGYAPSEHSESDSDNMTLDSRMKRNKKLAEDLKMEDKGYCKVKRNSVYGNTHSKLVDIELYSGSDNPGAKIRDAVTGAKSSQYRIGTKDEYLFFKVCIATGEKSLRTNKTFFFDSPEHYERHMRCSVDTNIKSAWADRNVKELLRRK